MIGPIGRAIEIVDVLREDAPDDTGRGGMSNELVATIRALELLLRDARTALRGTVGTFEVLKLTELDRELPGYQYCLDQVSSVLKRIDALGLP